jgi:hypothetical protein
MLRSSRTGPTKIGSLTRASAVIVGALVALFGVIAGPLLGVFAATSAGAATTGSGYTAITPFRALGTSAAGAPVVAGTPANVQITSTTAAPTTVPAGATAVVLNVTASSPTSAGYLEVYPEGAAPATPTSNVNFTAGETVANLVTVPLSTAGGVSVLNFAGTTAVDVDVEGYYSTTGAGLYNPVTPTRVAGTLAAGTPIAANTAIPVTVAGGTTGIPASATAVVVNLTAAGGTSASYLSSYAAGATPATTSSLNFTAGETVANRDIVNVGTGGQIEVYNFAGSVNADVDVDGYYGATGATFVPLAAPVRVADTRTTSTVGTQTAIPSGGTEAFNLATTASGIPTTATAVAANFTVVPGAAPGYITVFPTGVTTPPTASDVNWPAHSGPVPNFTQAGTSGTTAGSVNVYNLNSGSPIDVIVDAFGYFTSTPTNQTFAVSPAAAQNVTVSSGGAPTAGQIQYTVSGLGTAPVDIELFHAANVTGAAGGATFVNNGTSATQGTVAANITVVNGTPQAATQVNGVTPVAGAVTFTVNSTTSEADYPVVFTQPATGNALAVNASGAPTAAFGVGGEAIFNAAAAPNGTYTSEVVSSINSTNSTYQAGTGTPGGPFTFSYNTPGSSYSYAANTTTGTFPQSEAAFAADLTPGTVITSGYNTAGPSTFTVTVNPPASPTGLTAAYSATAGGNVLNWTAPAQPSVASYTVSRATVTGGVVGAYSNIATGITALTYTDTTGTAGLTYSYEVTAVGATGTGGADGNSAASVPAQASVPAAAFAALASAPVSLGSTLTPAGATGNVAIGDVITTTFNQPLATPAAGASVTLTSGGSVATLTSGTNATFAVSGTNSNVLTITVTGTPTFTSGASLAYAAAKYTASSGITGVPTAGGAGGLAWDLAITDGAGGATAQGIVAVPGTGTPTAPRVLGTFTNTTATTTVTGVAGTALPGATVTVTDTTHASTGTAVAAANGSFTIVLSVVPTTGDTLHGTETIQQEGAGNGTSGITTVTAL